MRLTLLLLLSFSTLSAVSFDCRKATKPSEKLICASAKLGRLDDELASVWRGRWAEHSALLAEQKQWLAWRDEQRDPREIERLYLDRIHVLRGSPVLPMSLIAGEYSFGSYAPPDPKQPPSFYNGPVYGSILVHERGTQIHIEATNSLHSNVCLFGATSTRREGNTFYFESDRAPGEDEIPRLTFYPSRADLKVTDAAGACGVGVHLEDTFPRVRATALSFPCYPTTSAAERTICRTPPLGALDLQLARRWKAEAMSQEESLKATAQRDRCGVSVACLMAWYNAQLPRKR